MWSEANWYGNPQTVALGASGSHVIHPRLGRIWDITTSGSGASVSFVDARLLSVGHVATIFCQGTHKIVVYDKDGGSLVANLFANFVARCTLLDNSTSAGTWLCGVKSFVSAPG